MAATENVRRRSAVSLTQLLLVVFLYVLLEWLFFATKASFLSLLPFREQWQVLFVAALPFLGYGLAIHVPLLLAALALRRRAPRLSRVLPAIGAAASATALGLLQLDNFTYIVFGFGIVHTSGLPRVLYLAGTAALLLLLIYYLQREQAAGVAGRRLRLRVFAAAALVAVAVGLALLRASSPARHRGLAADLEVAAPAGGRLPNVLLLAADGVDADHLAAYGYERRTTPHLDALIDDSLVVENAVANSPKTSASLISMLTGRLPTTTRLIHGPPHVLRAADAYRHLPGILKDLGYGTRQETIREWGDGADLNMRRAFDVANGRTLKGARSGARRRLGLPPRLAERFAWEQLFHDKLVDRIGERVLHVLGVARMENKLGTVKPVTTEMAWGTDDQTRVDRAIEFMKGSEGPFFAHLHLIGTHCCSYRPERRHFSAGSSKAGIETQEDADDAQNLSDFYDDTILSSDWHLGRILAWLEDSGELEKTVIVYSSDHGMGWDLYRRVPLILRFPHGEHRGRLVTQGVAV